MEKREKERVTKANKQQQQPRRDFLLAPGLLLFVFSPKSHLVRLPRHTAKQISKSPTFRAPQCLRRSTLSSPCSQRLSCGALVGFLLLLVTLELVAAQQFEAPARGGIGGFRNQAAGLRDGFKSLLQRPGKRQSFDFLTKSLLKGIGKDLGMFEQPAPKKESSLWRSFIVNPLSKLNPLKGSKDHEPFFSLEESAPSPVIQPYNYNGQQPTYYPLYPPPPPGYPPPPPPPQSGYYFNNQSPVPPAPSSAPKKKKAVKSQATAESAPAGSQISIGGAPGGGLALKWGRAQVTFKRGKSGPVISLGSASSPAPSSGKSQSSSSGISINSNAQQATTNHGSAATSSGSTAGSGISLSFGGRGGSQASGNGFTINLGSGKSERGYQSNQGGAVLKLPNMVIGAGNSYSSSENSGPQQASNNNGNTGGYYAPQSQNNYGNSYGNTGNGYVTPKKEKKPPREAEPIFSIKLPHFPKASLESNFKLPAIKLKLNSSPDVKVTTNSRDPLEEPEEVEKGDADAIFKTPEPFPKKWKNGTIEPLPGKEGANGAPGGPGGPGPGGFMGYPPPGYPYPPPGHGYPPPPHGYQVI